MIRAIRIISVVAACLMSTPALADGQVIARIIRLTYDATGVYVLTDGVKSNNPACSTATNQFGVSLSNTNAISFLMSARMTGTVIIIGGTGNCTISSGIEDLAWIGL